MSSEIYSGTEAQIKSNITFGDLLVEISTNLSAQLAGRPAGTCLYRSNSLIIREKSGLRAARTRAYSTHTMLNL